MTVYKSTDQVITVDAQGIETSVSAFTYGANISDATGYQGAYVAQTSSKIELGGAIKNSVALVSGNTLVKLCAAFSPSAIVRTRVFANDIEIPAEVLTTGEVVVKASVSANALIAIDSVEFLDADAFEIIDPILPVEENPADLILYEFKNETSGETKTITATGDSLVVENKNSVTGEIIRSITIASNCILFQGKDMPANVIDGEYNFPLSQSDFEFLEQEMLKRDGSSIFTGTNLNFSNGTYIEQAANGNIYIHKNASNYLNVQAGSVNAYLNGRGLFTVKEGDTVGHTLIQGQGAALQMLGGGQGIQARNSANNAYTNFYAAAFTPSSKRELKKNIISFNDNATKLIEETPVYNYNFNHELDSELPHTGIILDEAPVWLVDPSGQGIDLYAMAAVEWKAIQELSAENKALKNEVADIKAQLTAIMAKLGM